MFQVLTMPMTQATSHRATSGTPLRHEVTWILAMKVVTMRQVSVAEAQVLLK